MKRSFLFTTLFLFLFSFAILNAEESSRKLRVGIPLPLSGDLQAYGEELRNSFIVAKELLGPDNLELIFEDDRCDAKQGVTVAQKLLDLDKVNVITGIYCNHVLFPSAPIYNRKGIPVLTTGATTGDVKNIGRKIFRLFPADHLGVKPLLKVISSRHKRLCMLTIIDTYTELIQRTVLKEFSELKPPYALFAKDIDGSAKDFRTLLLTLATNKCEAIFLNAPGDDTFITLVKQTREQRLASEIYGFYMPGSNVVRKALGDQLNGVIYADVPSREEVETQLGKNFIESYKKRFGDFQVAQPIGLFAFEALRLIVEAEKVNKGVDEFIRGRMITDGAIKDYSFDDDGALLGLSFKVRRYENGNTTEIPTD